MKKIYKTAALLLFLSFFLFPSTAQALSPQILQRVEILKQEIALLRILISNLQLRQEISAPSYLAVNLSDNSIMLERESERPYPIASITKIMTALVASENIDEKQKILLTEEMLKPWGHSPSLFLGSVVSAENLLKASLIQSTNDASEALCFFMGKEKCISLMNQKAGSLGMNDTTFFDAHGLSPANRSTARDISKLLHYVYENHPEILSMTKDNDFWLPDRSGRLLKFMNVNNFYPLASFIGGKTGYLPEAKQTMASIFNVNGDPVAIVVLYSDNRQADIFTILRSLKN